MVNSEDFIKRLKSILDHYNLTASIFADKIEVQRSSISHILSGRNKPSLDFILKVTSTFKEVDMYWLLNGKGIFPKKEQERIQDVPSNSIQNNALSFSEETFTSKKIQRIVVFYENGTFDEYHK